MNAIELHSKGKPRLIYIDKISMIGNEEAGAFIYLVGDPYNVHVDESYFEIKNRLQEAGFIWNV